VRLGPDHQDVAHAAEIEVGELAALAPGPQHEKRRICKEFRAVAGAGLSAATRVGRGAAGEVGTGMAGLRGVTRGV
jgi:hypothetical protein